MGSGNAFAARFFSAQNVNSLAVRTSGLEFFRGLDAYAAVSD